MERLSLLDQPHHLLGRVPDLLGRLRQVHEAAETRRVDQLRRGAQHPELEPFLHLVEPILEVVHLRGEAEVAKDESGVGQSHGHL